MVWSLGQETSLEEMATHSSILAWKIPWTEKAWQATIYRITKNWTRLSNWAWLKEFIRIKGKWRYPNILWTSGGASLSLFHPVLLGWRSSPPGTLPPPARAFHPCLGPGSRILYHLQKGPLGRASEEWAGPSLSWTHHLLFYLMSHFSVSGRCPSISGQSCAVHHPESWLVLGIFIHEGSEGKPSVKACWGVWGARGFGLQVPCSQEPLCLAHSWTRSSPPGVGGWAPTLSGFFMWPGTWQPSRRI